LKVKPAVAFREGQNRKVNMKKALLLFVVSAGVLLLASNPAQASLTVSAGWDLLRTDPNSQDASGAHWQGVSIGNWNFGGSIGIRDVGETDTIVHRTADATSVGGTATVPVAMDVLQLRSVDPLSIGGGPVGYYYVTLQSLRGGPTSGGTMTISFGPEGDPHGTWNSTMSLYFDIRYGSLNGPIVAIMTDTISTSSQWRHESTPDALRISGVNYLLNGTDIYQDFWPGAPGPGIPGTSCETHQTYRFVENGTIVTHEVVTTCVPEPSTYIAGVLLLLPFGLQGIRILRNRR
jgi:hypothetical protein